MDPKGKLLKSNKDIPRWIIDRSVLTKIDRDRPALSILHIPRERTLHFTKN
jgi:hypothetical protein